MDAPRSKHDHGRERDRISRGSRRANSVAELLAEFIGTTSARLAADGVAVEAYERVGYAKSLQDIGNSSWQRTDHLSCDEYVIYPG